MPGLLIFIGMGIIFMTLLKTTGKRRSHRRDRDRDRPGPDHDHDRDHDHGRGPGTGGTDS
ncbi:MAG: hypothetical protein PF508_21945 [Spirochaeta sp.]|nr:hypothetical protein [Spirochaeta sp.]